MTSSIATSNRVLAGDLKATANAPDDDNHERLLVGSALLDPTTIDAVSEFVSGSQFTDKTLGDAFDLLADCYAAGRPIGDTSVAVSELRTAGLLDRLGGHAAIGTLIRDTPSAAGAVYHACQIARAAKMRSLLCISRELARRAQAATDAPAALIDWLHGQIQTLASDGEPDGVSTISESLRYLVDSMRASDAKLTAVPTGIATIDQMLGGLFLGDLTILAARPSVGKSAFGFQLAESAAAAGHVALFVSLEMGVRDLAARYAAGHTGLSAADLRAGQYDARDIDRIAALADDRRAMPLHAWPTRAATVGRIRGIARTVAARSGQLDLLVVDYLGLIQATDRRKPRWEQVTEISGALKTLATELDVSLVALCQVSRDCEGSTPNLSHLRESGAIEQDADQVLFLHRHRSSSETKLVVAKNRHGLTGQLSLNFDAEQCRFYEKN